MQSWRASLLRFDPDGQALFDEDGLLVVGPNAEGRQVVLAAGAYAALAAQYTDVPCTHLPGRILAPGFVDLHIHYPQTDVIGSPAEGLLPWLEHYTFPHEAQFADEAHAASVARFFCDELLRNGVTTSLTFSTSHVPSVNALFAEAQRRVQSILPGKKHSDEETPAPEPVVEPLDAAGEEAAAGKRNLAALRTWVDDSKATLDEWQKRVDGKIRSAIEGISPFAGVNKDVKMLSDRIAELEAKLRELETHDGHE